MTFGEATAWLFEQLPMYQRQGAAAYKTDLDGTWAVLEVMGRPDLQLPNVIHVAGTNGKGSVCQAVHNALRDQGLKVGLFTSPHLFDFRERMRVNGEMPSEQWVIEFVSTQRTNFDQLDLQPSFFEWTFGMAMCWFAASEVDLLVLETGMGGRLDSTNVFPNPLVTAITNIGLDHVQFLGNDIRTIAKEKAGIIKDGRPVVVGRMRPEAQSVILGHALKHGAEFHYAPEALAEPSSGPNWPENRATAHKILEVLSSEPGWRNIRVPNQTQLTKSGHLGRWHWLANSSDNARILIDCAHNEDGLRRTVAAIRKLNYLTLHIVFGAVSDKELASIWEQLPSVAQYHFCTANIPRALSVERLVDSAQKADRSGASYASVASALEGARASAQANDLIVVLGSIFVAAEALSTAESVKG
ncbi:MAG: tetrahydrofolate synthase [Crocinitomicaceae bacterium]|jgi:dihydrofolate synthase/folylpolyglutamate synthase|nr:tetrahydrofolate synthase [Crocinitomicaceae bacterium]|tara:strand:- start:5964 stop:7205 length:1242 start_codon:yes stop_codon:yes gene_type:complete